MTTYNSYQEAKIANPKEDIYTSMSGDFAPMGNIAYIALSGCKQGWNKCDPADYFMTLEKFLSDGHKLEVGDVIFGEDEDDVDVVSSDLHCRSFNMPVDADRHIYILRAAALEKTPTETPEEKEALDSIESDGVEWNGGKPNSGQDVFIAQMNTLAGVESQRYFIHQYWCDSNHQNQLLDLGILFTDSDSAISKTKSLLGIAEEELETPQQREDRERLASAYDLYECGQSAIKCIGYEEFNSFKNDDCAVKFWLAIVDKTNYRKEPKS